MRKLRIFVASPGDIREERDMVALVVDELRRTIAPLAKVELEGVRWETHAWPSVGEDAQDVINREIGDFDLLVGIMWTRFGTATKRAASGTGEEFERAYAYFRTYGRPKIMFYFRQTPFYTTDPKQWRQFAKVLEFRRKLEKLGVLFWEYSQPIEFERRVREHLTKHILELTAVELIPQAPAPSLFLSYKREDLPRVEPVYEALRAAGFQPWIDIKDILPGRQWIEEIEAAIKRSDFFLPFVSNRSAAEGHARRRSTFVSKEIDVALERELLFPPPSSQAYILPVRLDPVDPPLQLAQYQWVDLFAGGGLSSLISAIRTEWSHRPSSAK
ncbi:MAG TPA: TIR domain-containing protein [Thermoanaerobaculia bacterium]|jgi:hypothetical protein|nr:TIR domain-containing protein [Thermoanaerobaculia bacterium]